MIATSLINLSSLIGLKMEINEIITIMTVVGSASGTIVALKLGIKNLKSEFDIGIKNLKNEFEINLKELQKDIKNLTIYVEKTNGKVSKNRDSIVQHFIDFHSKKNDL